MSMWDDYFNSFKDITGTVIERTGKLVDVSRLRLTSAEISKEITRRYEALGRVVYDSAKAGTDISGLVTECVRSIDALYGRLDSVNSRVADLRDKKYCSSCGAVVDKESLFCSRCGSRVETGEERRRSARRAEAGAGEEAAKKAAEAVDEVLDKAKDAAQDAAGKVKQAAKDVIDDAKEAVDKAFGAAEDFVSGADDAAGEAADAAEDLIEDVSDKTEEALEEIADKLDGGDE